MPTIRQTRPRNLRFTIWTLLITAWFTGVVTTANAITPVGDFADNTFTVLGATEVPNPDG